MTPAYASGSAPQMGGVGESHILANTLSPASL